MVLAEAPLADVLAALALEVDRGGVEEDQLEVGEEVAPVGEQLLLDPVLGAAGGERRLVLLLVLGQLLAEPGHGPVEVVELEVVAALDLVVRLPLVGGPVAAGGEEAMQDGEEDGPLDVELEAASLQELLDDVPAAGLLPEPLEDQGGPMRRVVMVGSWPLAWAESSRTDWARRAPEARRASSCPVCWS